MNKRIIKEIFKPSKVGIVRSILAIILALSIISFLFASIIIYDQYNYLAISFLSALSIILGFVIRNKLQNLLTIRVNNDGISLNRNIGWSKQNVIKFSDISKIEFRERRHKYDVNITYRDQSLSFNIKELGNRDRFMDMLFENTDCPKIKKGFVRDSEV